MSIDTPPDASPQRAHPARRSGAVVCALLLPGAGLWVLGYRKLALGVASLAIFGPVWLLQLFLSFGCSARTLFFSVATILASVYVAQAVATVRASVRPTGGASARSTIGFAIAMLACSVVATDPAHVVTPVRVVTQAMAPAYLAGDHILVDQTVAPEALKHGDVVAVRPWYAGADEPGLRHELAPVILRVVGLPGDEIRFQGHRVFRNNVALEGAPCPSQTTPYRAHDLEDPECFMEPHEAAPSYAVVHDHKRTSCGTTPSFMVGAGRVFLMADNRDRASDSRRHGAAPMQSLLGRTLGTYWSSDVR